MDKEFESSYRSYMNEVIFPVHKAVSGVLDGWRATEFWRDVQEDGASIPQPIQDIRYRDKRLESILDKFTRQRSDFPKSNGDSQNLREMRDILGVRIVVYVPDQLRLIDRAIRSSVDIELVPELMPRCYLPQETFGRIRLDPDLFDHRGPKNSGYASVHYFARLRSPVAEENPIFEIQTRTMLEQVWGEIEHQLGYKVDQNTEFSVQRQFRVLSHHLSALDDHFDLLYDRLNYLQKTSNPRDEDTLNAENLPRIMHDHQILLQQGEIDQLLRILATNSVIKVGQLKRRLRPGLLDVIRDEFSALHPNDQIGAFDVIPALATLGVNATAKRAQEAYRQTQEFGELVRTLRSEMRDELRQRMTVPPGIDGDADNDDAP